MLYVDEIGSLVLSFKFRKLKRNSVIIYSEDNLLISNVKLKAAPALLHWISFFFWIVLRITNEVRGSIPKWTSYFLLHGGRRKQRCWEIYGGKKT